MLPGTIFFFLTFGFCTILHAQPNGPSCTRDSSNGSWVDGTTLWWKPETCSDMQPISSVKFSDCIRNRRFAFFGDSILRNIFHELIRLEQPELPVQLGSGQLRVLQGKAKNMRKVKTSGYPHYSYKLGAGVVDIYYLHSTLLVEQAALKILNKGRYTDVVVSNSLWDMGITFRGLAKYAGSLKRNLKAIQRVLPREHGKLVLLGLHYVNTSRCTSVACKVCNHEVIQDYIRCAQQHSASCTPGVTLVNTVQFTKNKYATARSPDGTHFNSEVTKIQMQHVLHALCPQHSSCKKFEHPESKCNVAFKNKIATNIVLEARDEVSNEIGKVPCSTAFDELLSW